MLSDWGSLDSGDDLFMMKKVILLFEPLHKCNST